MSEKCRKKTFISESRSEEIERLTALKNLFQSHCPSANSIWQIEITVGILDLERLTIKSQVKNENFLKGIPKVSGTTLLHVGITVI